MVGSLTPEERQAIADLQTAVDTLVGEDDNKSVATIVTERVAELLIPENADESLDTLEEIAAWIQDHPGSVAEMNSDILQLQSDVADLEELLNGDGVNPGLEARVSTLETTMGTFTPVTGSYLDVGSAISYLNTSVTEMNDRLR